ncbi:MAG: acyl-CoA dehydrogenase family protein [Naasia sp.]
MTTSPSSDGRCILSDELLELFRSRAAGYDAANTFFQDDFDDLVRVGYLKALVPEAQGGAGLTLAELAAEQRRLAAAAPATALGINMHLVWTSVARVVQARGFDFLDGVLHDASRGEVFAFAISEAGNDLVLFGSRTRAERDADGGYRYTGTKIFTSLSPVWTRLSVFGVDDSGSDPALVHGFLRRDADGHRSVDDWDTVGMRATQSRTTILDGARVRPEDVVRRLPVGPSADPLVFGIFASFEILLAAVYTGIGDRALQLAVANATRRTSMKNGGASYAQDPDIRWRVAHAAIAQDSLGPQLTSLATDVDSLVDHGAMWFAKLVGLKVRATETARDVVDAAIRVSGGSSYSSSSELGRLYRDVLAGMFHPSDDESAHSTVANAWLGPIA